MPKSLSAGGLNGMPLNRKRGKNNRTRKTLSRAQPAYDSTEVDYGDPMIWVIRFQEPDYSQQASRVFLVSRDTSKILRAHLNKMLPYRGDCRL